MTTGPPPQTENSNKQGVNGVRSGPEAEAGPPARASTASTTDLRHRLLDLLFCFPAAAIEGVKWTILRQKYEERFAEPPCPEEPPEALLHDFVSTVSGKNGSGAQGAMLLLKDAAALAPERYSIGNWPALYRVLCEIIMSHGSVQPQSLGVTREDEVIIGEVLSKGLLLAQLKPLLQSHWDADFEEHSLGYFDEQGTFVRMRKMKQLIQSMLRWREQRLALHKPGASDILSEVDAALRAPLDLAVSRRHNDMVLCCPVFEGGTLGSTAPAIGSTAPAHHVGPNSGSSVVRSAGETSLRMTGHLVSHDFVANGTTGRSQMAATRAAWDVHQSDEGVLPAKTTTTEEDRVAALERENLQLRIENAELKKQVRFKDEAFNAQIRVLRVENAELRKRLYGVPSRLLVTLASTPEQLQTMSQAPSDTDTTFDDPFEPPPEPHRLPCDSWSPSSSSGVVSPAGPGQVSPGQQHAWTATCTSPGQASPGHANHRGPPVHLHPLFYAVVPGHWPASWPGQTSQMTSPPTGQSPMSAMSPLSNLSHCMPQGLLDSSGNSSSLGSLVGPGGMSPSPCGLVDPSAALDLLSADDRAKIPPGIVDQQRSRFELEREKTAGAEAPEETATEEQGEGFKLVPTPAEP